MASGKFSNPRTPQREEQEIDLAFQQLTGQAAPEQAPEGSPAIARNRKIVALSLCALGVALLLGILIGSAILLSGGADNGLILNNVTVAGVNLGGMTPEEAATVLRRATENTYAYEDMVITLPGGTLRLSPKDTGARLDVEAAVQAAYSYGRSGIQEADRQAYAQSLVKAHAIAALPYLELDRAYIRQTLEHWFQGQEDTFTQSSHSLEGDMPPLSGEDFDESKPCQTLVLYTGTPGRSLSLEQAYNDVLDAYSFNIFQVEVRYGEGSDQPEPLELEAIWQELHREPVDAEMNMETFEVTPEVYGYTFDLEKAEKLLKIALPGQELRLEMTYITPQVLGRELEDMLYRDALGQKQTLVTGDDARIANIKLACEAISGTVVAPGGEFSLLEAVGKLTEAAGFKPATPHGNWDGEPTIGGGVGQVASTLYTAALLADLRVTQRQAHTHAPDYIEPGLDAAIGGSRQDLRFTNSTLYPIRIQATITGDQLQVTILGSEQRDYFVQLDTAASQKTQPKTVYREYAAGSAQGYYNGQVLRQGQAGQTVTVTQTRISRETGQRIRQSTAAESTYQPLDTIAVKLVYDPAPAPTDPTDGPGQTEPAPGETEATPGETEAAPGATEAAPDEATVVSGNNEGPFVPFT